MRKWFLEGKSSAGCVSVSKCSWPCCVSWLLLFQLGKGPCECCLPLIYTLRTRPGPGTLMLSQDSCASKPQRGFGSEIPSWWEAWHSCVSDSLLQPFVFTQIITGLLDISVKSSRRAVCPWPCSSVQGKDDEQLSLLKTESYSSSFRFARNWRIAKANKLPKTTGGWISNFLR